MAADGRRKDSPAVSGTGSPLLDCDADGRYNPFRTAQREAFEEATGPLLPDRP